MKEGAEDVAVELARSWVFWASWSWARVVAWVLAAAWVRMRDVVMMKTVRVGVMRVGGERVVFGRGVSRLVIQAVRMLVWTARQ